MPNPYDLNTCTHIRSLINTNPYDLNSRSGASSIKLINSAEVALQVRRVLDAWKIEQEYYLRNGKSDK